MKSQWVISALAKEIGLEDSFASMDTCLALQGRQVSKGPSNTVTLHEVNGQTFYMKRFVPGKRWLRKYFVRSRVRAEWENLLWFQKYGIETPRILAYGEEYDAGKFCRGVLVTSALHGANDMEGLAKSHSDIIFSREKFRIVAKKIAVYTKAMHEKNFTHNDLDWRNILVTDALNVYFFDCPGGRRWVWPFLEYRIVKDLSHLDKIACDCLPLRWRLWFYQQYTGRKKLTKADRVRLQKIARYYDGR